MQEKYIKINNLQVSEKLSDFVSGNSDLEKELGAKAIQGKGYLPGSED